MSIRRWVVAALLACFAVSVFAQQPVPQRSVPYWTVLVDPVCPVASFYANSAPNTSKKMRVMYFPDAKGAQLKNPQFLTLNVSFNSPVSRSSAVIPFTRKGDYWEAEVPLEKFHAMYAIFSVKDEKTNAVDDNGGKLWNVVFCGPTGQKDLNSVLRQAQSYTGVSWPLDLHRPRDYAKAISVIENAMAQVQRLGYGLEDLWNYEVQRDGSDAQAWANVAKEIKKFLADHPNDRRSMYAAGSFVVSNQDKLPAAFVENTINVLDEKLNDPKNSLRAQLDYVRTFSESDPKKRLAALDAVIVKYPTSMQAAFAQKGKFYTLVDMGDVAGAGAAFEKDREAMSGAVKNGLVDPSVQNDYMILARLYIDKDVKLEDALKLITEANDSLKSNHAFVGGKVPEEIQRSMDAQSALFRAEAYLGLHKLSQALPEAQKALELQKSPETHFVFAQALAIAGDRNKALDEYFDAALLPSNKDLEYGAELQRFYLRRHFGNARQFEAELQKRKAARFREAHYVPRLVDRPAPPFQFATLKGEKFDAAVLAGRTVIVNFWSPG